MEEPPSRELRLGLSTGYFLILAESFVMLEILGPQLALSLLKSTRANGYQGTCLDRRF